MKKLILIVCTILLSAPQAQAMSNKLFTGITATAGAAALASGLGWYYQNNKQTNITSQLSAQRERLARLSQAMRENTAAISNDTLTDEEREALVAEYRRLQEEYAIEFNNYSAQFNGLEQQRLQAISSAYSCKQGVYASAAIGALAGIKAGVVTPLTAAVPTVLAGAAHQIYMYSAQNTATNTPEHIAQATELYDAAQKCKYAMLAGGATALAAAGAQYVPNVLAAAAGMLQSAGTATKVGIGLTLAAGTIAVGMKVVPPVVNAINRIRSVAAWFGA